MLTLRRYRAVVPSGGRHLGTLAWSAGTAPLRPAGRGARAFGPCAAAILVAGPGLRVVRTAWPCALPTHEVVPVRVASLPDHATGDWQWLPDGQVLCSLGCSAAASGGAHRLLGFRVLTRSGGWSPVAALDTLLRRVPEALRWTQGWSLSPDGHNVMWRTVPPFGPDDGIRAAWVCLCTGADVVRTWPAPADAACGAWTPDSKQWAFVSYLDGVSVWLSGPYPCGGVAEVRLTVAGQRQRVILPLAVSECGGVPPTRPPLLLGFTAQDSPLLLDETQSPPALLAGGSDRTEAPFVPLRMHGPVPAVSRDGARLAWAENSDSSGMFRICALGRDGSLACAVDVRSRRTPSGILRYTPDGLALGYRSRGAIYLVPAPLAAAQERRAGGRS